MNKEINHLEDELRPEYDFTQLEGGVRGKYAAGSHNKVTLIQMGEFK